MESKRDKEVKMYEDSKIGREILKEKVSQIQKKRTIYKECRRRLNKLNLDGFSLVMKERFDLT